MNTNIINQEQEALNILFSQIPEEEFYINILTRTKVLNIYEKYEVKSSKLPLKPQVVIRAILNRALRYMDMSVQELDILLAVGINNLNKDVLKMSVEQLIHNLVQENIDTSDIYIIERIVGQINNKLPYDLRPKFRPEHKINIIKLINNSVAFKDNLKYFKDDTKQFTPDKFYLTKYGYEGFSNDNNTSLDNKYLKSLELDYNDIVNHNDWNNLRKKGYELKDYQDKVTMEIDAGTYEQQLKLFLDDKAKTKKTEDNSKKETSLDKILAMYIDKYPNLHYSPEDGKFYFYDHAGGTLIDADGLNSEFHIEIDTSNPKLSSKDKAEFVKMLKEYNIPRNKIDNAVDYIESTDLLPNYNIVDGEIVSEENVSEDNVSEENVSEENISELIIQEEDMTNKTNWILYILIGLLILLVIVAVIYYFLNRDKIMKLKFMSTSMNNTTTKTRNDNTSKFKRTKNNNLYTDKLKKMLKQKNKTGTTSNNSDFRKV